MKINNFSAGPSKIPNEILQNISEEIIDYKDLGYSVLELSHRGVAYEELVSISKSKLRKILHIPDDFQIIFIQGGATFQNTFIPVNKKSLIDNISFLISGTWGKKTHSDFELYFGNKISNHNVQHIGYENALTDISNSDEEYLYFTSNETIEGIQIRDFNTFKNKKLIVDMSSDICSYKFDWSNLSYIYAGAQKNLGIPGVTICIFRQGFHEKNTKTSYLDIENHILKNSSFNTPPTFSIYVLSKMLDWIIKSGGIKRIEENNYKRANKIYQYLDENDDYFQLPAPKNLRSYSNIVFDFKEGLKTQKFLNHSVENGFIGLNGHRSVGGIRVSNYNSITDEMIDDFLVLLEDFVN
jgi:phosphoserine aminotransferase